MNIKKLLDIEQSEETREYKYHNLPRAFDNTRFWKPIIAIGIGTFIYLIIQTAFIIGSFFAFGLNKKYPLEKFISNISNNVQADLVTIFILFGSIALILPVLFLTLFITRMTPINMIASVELKLRWKLLFKSLLVSGIFTFGLIIIGGLIDGSIYSFSLPEEAKTPTYWIFFSIIIFLIVPIQCIAEEYAFRGFMIQTLGNWFGSSVISIGLTSIAFAFAHFYQAWAFISVFIFGLISGYLVYKTGGLEASIAMHIINNMVAVMYMIFVTKTYDPNSSGSAIELILSVGQMLIITLIILKIAKKDKIKNSFIKEKTTNQTQEYTQTQAQLNMEKEQQEPKENIYTK